MVKGVDGDDDAIFYDDDDEEDGNVDEEVKDINIKASYVHRQESTGDGGPWQVGQLDPGYLHFLFVVSTDRS